MFDAAPVSPGGETATAQQIVILPSGGTATLTFFLRVAAVTAPSTSTLTISVDGAVVQTINEPAAAEAGYTQINVDLSAFASGVPRLLSFNYNRPAGAADSDNFMVDDVALATTCASPFVNISGRVFTPSGQALRNAVVSLIDSQNVRRTATTSSFGIYSFGNVRIGETYVLNVASKRFRFAPQILQFTTSVTNVDLIGLE